MLSHKLKEISLLKIVVPIHIPRRLLVNFPAIEINSYFVLTYISIKELLEPAEFAS